MRFSRVIKGSTFVKATSSKKKYNRRDWADHYSHFTTRDWAKMYAPRMWQGRIWTEDEWVTFFDSGDGAVSADGWAEWAAGE